MIRFCAAPQCDRRVTGFSDFCARHHAMLPLGQARLIRKLAIARFHASPGEARQHLDEQHAGYVGAAARQLPEAR